MAKLERLGKLRSLLHRHRLTGSYPEQTKKGVFFAKTPFEVPRIGLEPTRLTAPDPKSGVATNYTTWALMRRKGIEIFIKNYIFQEILGKI